MPRKFRLSVKRKYEWKAMKTCHVEVKHLPVPVKTVSIQPDQVSQPLIASLPSEIMSTVQSASEPVQPMIISLPRPVFLSADVPSLKILQSRTYKASALPPEWFETTATDELLVYSQVRTTDRATQVLLNLEISNDFTWTVRSLGNLVELKDKTIMCSPRITSVEILVNVINFLTTCHYCCGNEDEKYFSIQADRKGVFKDVTGSTTVAVYVKDYFPYHTIRCSCCQVLLPQESTKRCKKCSEYRKVLNILCTRAASKDDKKLERSNPASRTNYRWLRTPEKVERIRRLRLRARVYQQQIRRISQRLEQSIEEHGIQVESDLHEELVSIMDEYQPQMSDSDEYPPGSFQQIFWAQQHCASMVQDSRAMKWEPAMIRWCLYIRHLSSSAYEVLRNSGVIRLPSQRTLRDYTYYTKACLGFSKSVDVQLMEAGNVASCPEREKYVIIILDEMHLKEDLVYDKHTGQIIGFTNLGNINDHLREYEKTIQGGEEKEEPLAKSMLVIMIRGLFSKFQFAYAQFSCSDLNGCQLYPIFWEAVERIERCGFRVIGCTCDGLSVNRRFFKLHDMKDDVYKAINPYSEEPQRHIFFFSDPPHLIKTVRNCWASNKRLLWFEGKYIQWSHLVSLYQKSRPDCTSPGLTVLPKLKYEHVDLTSFSKMRVDLAAQALSNSVAEALNMMKDPELEKTIMFCKIFDKFFDCLNVSSLDLGTRSRNAFKAPYHSGRDFRIKWLKEEFLGFLDRWEKSVGNRQGFNKTQKNKMLLSHETRLGLRLTVHSFIDFVEYIFTIPGVSVFLSNRICQDPLENFFGQQRQRGRVNENPNVADFMKNTQALRVVNTTCAPVRSNCRGSVNKRKDKGPITLDNTPLNKRKRKHK